MKNFIAITLLCLCMTAYTQQGAHATITWLADKCMVGNGAPAEAQWVVHTAINTAFGAMGRRRLMAKRRLSVRRMGTMASGCTAVYNSAVSAAGMPPAAAACFAADFNVVCVAEVAKVCTNAYVCT